MGRTNTVKGGQPHSSAQHGPQPPAVSWPWVSTLQTGMGITKRRFLKSCQLSPLSVKGHPPLNWPGFPEFLSLHSQGGHILVSSSLKHQLAFLQKEQKTPSCSGELMEISTLKQAFKMECHQQGKLLFKPEKYRASVRVAG